jgi:plasmid stability protein
MATVTIRNLDDGVVKEMKRLAKEHNRSLEAELRQMIIERAELRARKARLLKVSRQIAASSPEQKTDSVEIIRQMREDRMNELGC